MLSLITAPTETLRFNYGELHNNQYVIVNDSVMGGRSQSQLIINSASANFSGNLSLENNGGVASVRMIWPFSAKDSNSKNLIALKVNGDGQKYKLRLRTNRGYDGAAYSASFSTVENQDQTIYFSVDDFVPQFRGRTLKNMPKLKLEDVQQMGIMLADYQKGNFSIKLIELALN